MCFSGWNHLMHWEADYWNKLHQGFLSKQYHQCLYTLYNVCNDSLFKLFKLSTLFSPLALFLLFTLLYSIISYALLYSNCFTLHWLTSSMYAYIYWKVRTLLEWAEALLSKKWSGLGNGWVIPLGLLWLLEHLLW